MRSIQRRSVVLGPIVAVASLLPLQVQSQNQYGPGVTDTQIKIGISVPLSGPVSGYALSGKVFEGYFRKVNEAGGIHGRQVRIIMLDDQYSPPKAVEVTRRLVEREQVLAIVGTLGTGTNTAIQRYLNVKKVPQLFVQSGIEKLNDPKNSPWTVPFAPSYLGEGKAIAQAIVRNKPEAKVAVLSQNDDLGKEVMRGLREGFGAQAAQRIVAHATYEVSDPTVDSQVVQLRSSGADTIVTIGTGRFAAQAIRKIYDLGWKPDQYLNWSAGSLKLTFTPAGLEKSAGVMTMAVYKDPSQPRWSNDPEVLEYQALVRKYAPGEDPMSGVGVSGYLIAQVLEKVLTDAGNKLTRENLLALSSNIQGFRARMLLPGVTMGNSPQNLHVVDSFQPVRFNGSELEPVGDVVKLR